MTLIDGRGTSRATKANCRQPRRRLDSGNAQTRNRAEGEASLQVGLPGDAGGDVVVRVSVKGVHAAGSEMQLATSSGSVSQASLPLDQAGRVSLCITFRKLRLLTVSTCWAIRRRTSPKPRPADAEA